MPSGIIEEKMIIPAQHETNLYGQFDQNAKKLERALHVELIPRDGELHILGTEAGVQSARRCLEQLLHLSEKGNPITEQEINYLVSLAMEDQESAMAELDADCICHATNGRPVKPRTLGQKKYVDAIRNNMIVFGLGPAGTGKTYLAMAMAITAFRSDEEYLPSIEPA